jgi:eukaryotic-like serine/threonine-protein kinase
MDHPLLRPGTQVDGWTVLEHRSQGSYGSVYRAVRTGQEHVGPVALKLAHYPWDPRFAREGEALSRIHHPSVPRLLGRGIWRPAPGVEHPYLVMEWIDGTPLYEWARQHAPSTQQVRQLLSQLAQALAATHAVNAVHRDVKGDNILVCHSDGRAVLIDFGSVHYQGASRLTWQLPPPGTPAYHSPEASLFMLRSVRSPFAYFEASPATDLYALGATAYYLVMGDYPPRPEPSQDMEGAWHLARQDLQPLLERNPRVDPQLSECILRLLSMEPVARGTTIIWLRCRAPLRSQLPLWPIPHHRQTERLRVWWCPWSTLRPGCL